MPKAQHNNTLLLRERNKPRTNTELHGEVPLPCVAVFAFVARALIHCTEALPAMLTRIQRFAGMAAQMLRLGACSLELRVANVTFKWFLVRMRALVLLQPRCRPGPHKQLGKFKLVLAWRRREKIAKRLPKFKSASRVRINFSWRGC
jgi:hypothetical protein